VSSLVLGAALVGLLGAAETLALAGVVAAVVGAVFLVLLARVGAVDRTGHPTAVT
jgi:uncharacterized membrane protein YeaQ/YmgE (transglycosylase-associated protein family)